MEIESSFNESEKTEKLKNKFLRDPLVGMGLLALTGIVGFGAYKIKTSKGQRLSLQLINLRLAAQGTFVGFLTAGVIYSFCKKHLGLFNSETKD